jgi:hypothetical protein
MHIAGQIFVHMNFFPAHFVDLVFRVIQVTLTFLKHQVNEWITVAGKFMSELEPGRRVNVLDRVTGQQLLSSDPVFDPVIIVGRLYDSCRKLVTFAKTSTNVQSQLNVTLKQGGLTRPWSGLSNLMGSV